MESPEKTQTISTRMGEMTAVADPKTGCTDGGKTHFHSSPRAFTLELIISMLATEFSRDLGEKEEGKMMGAIKASKEVIFPAARHHLRSTRWTLP